MEDVETNDSESDPPVNSPKNQNVKHGLTSMSERDPFSTLNKGLFREIGKNAIWTVSSQKAGFGAQKLRDDQLDTYWQSDAQLPHFINILFRKKTIVSDVCLFFKHDKDESYTPCLISLRSGSSVADLQTLDDIKLDKPNGWVIIPLKNVDKTKLLKTFLLQIAILANHHNGRDSHVRQIKIHSPIEPTTNGLLPVPKIALNFTTQEFLQFSTLR